MSQQETDEVMESEDGSVEFETPTDDEEVMIPSQDKYKKVPDIPISDIRDEQTLSNTQREDWLLPTEPMHGARPRQTGRERPPVIDNPALRDAAGNTARMQKDLAMLREENLRTPATSQVIQAPRRAALTTTHVPRFDGTTSWEQYHPVFEVIVRSNGWDNDTAALQLFSHLEGDALNVAHLVPLARRLSRSGLVDALTAHYGSPGRLADYRRQFERTTRTVGEDPAIFATALETLAVKAFGDMGQTARL